jgi:hypothetical protein
VKPAGLARALICTAIVGSPAEARFLQVDPVGYKDEINLYAYVGDDPLNGADPTGMDAIVLIQDETHIQIILPVTFAGDAANAPNIAAFTSNVQQRWTGTFDGINVKTTVVQGSSSLAPNVRNSVMPTAGNTSRTGVPGEGHSVTNSRPPSSEITMKDGTAPQFLNPAAIHQLGTRELTPMLMKRAISWARQTGRMQGH